MKNNGTVKQFSEVEAKEFGKDAPGVKIRVLIGENDGNPRYILRMIEIEPGGNTPLHEHGFEHENFVLEGEGRVLLGEDWHELRPGSVVYVPPGLRHQYVNAGAGKFIFLCGIPSCAQ